MVELEFLKSNDEEIIGRYVTFKNDLIIGSSIKSDLVIADPELDDFHLTLYVTSSGVTSSNNGLTSPFYHINGKKIFGDKKNKVNDEIRIGKTTFRIIGFSYESFDDETLLREKYKEIKRNSPELNNCLDELKAEYIRVNELKE